MLHYNKDLFEKAKSLLAILDDEGRFLEVSQHWEKIIGWTLEELKSKKYTDILHPDDIEGSVQAAKGYDAKGVYSEYYENRFRHKNGGYVWLQWDGFSFDEGKIYGVARDITNLKEKEFFFEEMQKVAKIGCWNFNLRTGKSDLSNGIYQIMECAKSVELSIAKGIKYFPEDVRSFIKDIVKSLIETNQDYDLELPFITNLGNHRVVRILSRSRETAGAKEIFGLMQDITDQVEKQKELEVQRIKSINASKMASLGEMAANMAHEINNPLSLILGRAEQLGEKVRNNKISTEELLVGLTQIEKTSDRIARIIKSLKIFSKSDKMSTFLKIPLKSIIEDTLELCAQKLTDDGYNLVISKIPDIYINCKGSQLSQVFLNLINNSVEALAGKNEKWIKFNFELKNKYVLIEVTDSGQGIEKSIHDKIMQPFFTTKENKGTGLGLSISRGIISDHNGKIYYDDSKKRTTFSVELPYEEK